MLLLLYIILQVRETNEIDNLVISNQRQEEDCMYKDCKREGKSQFSNRLP